MELTIKNICSELHDTYNGDVLNNIVDDKIHSDFKLISSIYKDGNKGNTALLNIIYNHYYGKIHIPHFISGPMSISYHTSVKYDMKIYIFGEYHGFKYNCNDIDRHKSNSMDITKYLDSIFTNSDKFIDFYLEDIKYSEHEYNYENIIFMSKLRKNFHNCINALKRSNCIYKTMRAHYVDIRYEEKEGIIFGKIAIKQMLLQLNIENHIRDFKSTIKQLSKLHTYNDIINYVIETAISIPILNKELNRSNLDKKTNY